METTSIFLSPFILLLVNGCSAADLKVNVSTKSGLDSNSSGTGRSNERTGWSNLGTNAIEIHRLKVDKANQVNKLKNGTPIKNDTDESITMRQSYSKETYKMKKSNDDAKEEPKAKDGSNKDDNPSNDAKEEPKSKQVPKTGGNDEDSD